MITFTGMARGTVLSCPGPSDSGTGRPYSESLARCRVPAAAAAALPSDLNLIPSPTVTSDRRHTGSLWQALMFKSQVALAGESSSQARSLSRYSSLVRVRVPSCLSSDGPAALAVQVSVTVSVPLAVLRSPGPHWQALAGGLSGPMEPQPSLRVKHSPGSGPAARLKACETVMGQQDSDELRVPAVSRVSY